MLEFEFATPVGVGQGLVTQHGEGNPGVLIPTTESIRRPNCLRLTPVNPLTVGNYYNVSLAGKIYAA